MGENFLERFNLKPNLSLCELLCATVDLVFIDPLGSRVGQSVESALIALAAIFMAHSAYFNNFRQEIPYFDASQQMRVLFNCFATKQCLGMLKM